MINDNGGIKMIIKEQLKEMFIMLIFVVRLHLERRVENNDSV